MTYKEVASNTAIGLANGVTRVDVVSDVTIQLPPMADGDFATFVLRRSAAGTVQFPSLPWPGGVPPELPATTGSAVVLQLARAGSVTYEVSRSVYDAGA